MPPTARGAARLRQPSHAVRIAELDTLGIAHLDCDAFYAAIEKRDNPSLRDKPVIVGGGSRRGVVSTCCYVARIFGVRSAMPMFKALELCPQAVVIRPNFAKYTAAAKQIRAMMLDLTPLVEPLSLDEAYPGPVRHGTLARRAAGQDRWRRLRSKIETEVGISVSIGLSFNKFLAKLASELDKPRGFAVIGEAEALAFLRDKPVGFIRGAGAALQARLAKDGITHIAQLQDTESKGTRQALRQHRSVAASPGARPGHAHRRAGRRTEEHLVGDDLRREHLGASTNSKRSSGARPNASPPAPRRRSSAGAPSC